MVTATIDIVQCYCVVCVEFIVVTVNSRYNVMVLCFVWSLLWLQQQ